MFQELLTGTACSVSRRTAPGLVTRNPIRAFPLRCQLVGILGRLNAPKNKVAFLKASGMDLAAMVAAQVLLVACCSHNRPKTIFLKEHCIILPQLLLLKLIISEHSRSPVYEFSGENCFFPVYQGKRCLAGGLIWRRPDRPKNRQQLINPAPSTLVQPVKGLGP